MNTSTKFGLVDLALMQEQLAKVQEQLWEMQLSQFPTSVKLTGDEIRELCDSKPAFLDATMERWDQTMASSYTPDMAKWARRDERQKLILDHRAQAGRYIARCLFDEPYGIFYKCAPQPDGSYRYIGFRYGFEDYQYASGFPASSGWGYP
jgi:hypothetical protein